MNQVAREEAPLYARYAIKVMSNMASVPLFLALEAILPRAMGPAAYGNFNFAVAVYRQLVAFLDMGTSTCFYNALSRDQADFSLVAFYARVAAVLVLACSGIALTLCLPVLGNVFLPEVPPVMGLLAAGLACLMWLTQIARSLDDALGRTMRSELIRITVNILAMAAVVALFLAGWLRIGVIFLHHYLMYGILAAGYLYCLRGAWPERSYRLGAERFCHLRRMFTAYSTPLFVQALASLVFLFADRWILQYFDGSAAQGYFSLSQKVGMACFLFVTAMTPLIMRELALAHGRGEPGRMAALIDRYGPMLYAVAAYFSCFVAVESEAVVLIFGGASFASAVLPVRIMALYPLHQSYGQVVASVFYANGDTRTLRDNTVASLVCGVIVSWLLLAPPHLGGLAMGATGLAIKMVAVQVLFVNILLWRCSRAIPLNLGRNLAHQVYCPLTFLILAWLAHSLSSYLPLPSQFTATWRFLASGFAYSVFCFVTAFTVPMVWGMSRPDLAALWRLVQKMVRR